MISPFNTQRLLPCVEFTLAVIGAHFTNHILGVQSLSAGRADGGNTGQQSGFESLTCRNPVKLGQPGDVHVDANFLF